MQKIGVVFAVAVLSIASGTWYATRSAPRPGDLDMARPIPAFRSFWTEELTWLEIRDALKSGTDIVIIPTGGVEQNGPYTVTGKHNFVLQIMSEAIARKLGNALVAPIVPFVPEGRLSPPAGHMLYPGTISVRETTFKALLTDISESFAVHGFKHVILIGDSGGNQKGMQEVAKSLSRKWQNRKTRFHYIPDYYQAAWSRNGVGELLASLGIEEAPEGIHDSFYYSAVLSTLDPLLIRTEQRRLSDKLTINGIDLSDTSRTKEIGEKLIEFVSRKTAAAIRLATDNH